jgi:diguanylate cyclase (GGDEF) domain
MPLLMQGLGLALNNALLHDDLQRVAALDPLTGIYNRRFGYKRLEEELTRASRDHTSLSVLLLDLDHFKRVNDTYGHLSGDKVLIRTANVCREILREGDVLMRYGGEEFVVVLPGASIQDAREVAERIRFAISQSQINLGDQLLQVTSSIGVAATTGQKAIAADELIALADERLYKAKATGRNKVVSDAVMAARPVVTTKAAQ